MSERSLGRLERIRTFFLALPPAAALAALAALDWGAAGGCGSGREGGGVSDRDRGGKNPSGSFSARPGPDDAPGSPLATRRRARSSADGSGGMSRRGRVTHHLRRYSPSSCKENERGRDLGLKHRGRARRKRRPVTGRLHIFRAGRWANEGVETLFVVFTSDAHRPTRTSNRDFNRESPPRIHVRRDHAHPYPPAKDDRAPPLARRARPRVPSPPRHLGRHDKRVGRRGRGVRHVRCGPLHRHDHGRGHGDDVSVIRWW